MFKKILIMNTRLFWRLFAVVMLGLGACFLVALVLSDGYLFVAGKVDIWRHNRHIDKTVSREEVIRALDSLDMVLASPYTAPNIRTWYLPLYEDSKNKRNKLRTHKLYNEVMWRLEHISEWEYITHTEDDRAVFVNKREFCEEGYAFDLFTAGHIFSVVFEFPNTQTITEWFRDDNTWYWDVTLLKSESDKIVDRVISVSVWGRDYLMGSQNLARVTNPNDRFIEPLFTTTTDEIVLLRFAKIEDEVNNMLAGYKCEPCKKATIIEQDKKWWQISDNAQKDMTVYILWGVIVILVIVVIMLTRARNR